MKRLRIFKKSKREIDQSHPSTEELKGIWIFDHSNKIKYTWAVNDFKNFKTFTQRATLERN